MMVPLISLYCCLGSSLSGSNDDISGSCGGLMFAADGELPASRL
jgi:hypothetical protein